MKHIAVVVSTDATSVMNDNSIKQIFVPSSHKFRLIIDGIHQFDETTFVVSESFKMQLNWDHCYNKDVWVGFYLFDSANLSTRAMLIFALHFDNFGCCCGAFDDLIETVDSFGCFLFGLLIGGVKFGRVFESKMVFPVDDYNRIFGFVSGLLIVEQWFISSKHTAFADSFGEEGFLPTLLLLFILILPCIKSIPTDQTTVIRFRRFRNQSYPIGFLSQSGVTFKDWTLALICVP